MTVAITFDIDWAPDWCVHDCAELVRKARTQATFFVTHSSAILDTLRGDSDRFELGVHPNFLPASTQGSGMHEILDHCISIVPEATAIRTHCLVQSTTLFQVLIDHYSGIEVDVSLLLPFHEGLTATALFLNECRRPLIRLPYLWEDDIAAQWPTFTWNQLPFSNHGLRIYDFHPIHVALNTDTMERYASLKRSCVGRPLHSLSRNDVAPFVNHGEGARSFLERILGSASAEPLSTVTAIGRRIQPAGYR